MIRTLVRRAMIALVATMMLSPPASRAEEGDPENEICGSAVAYSVKVGKAQRRRREEEAKREAVTDLARRLWSDAFGARAGSGFSDADTERAFTLLRGRYRVNARLDGGIFDHAGNKQEKEIFYCVEKDDYFRVRNELRDQRRAAIEALELRFTQLELLMQGEDYTGASRLLTELEIDVVDEALDQWAYTSVDGDRTRPFDVWLLEWGDRVPMNPQYLSYMNNEADRLIHQGKLNAADRYLSESLQADRSDPTANELRELIQELRNERVNLLRAAEELAVAGRFKAAQKKFDEADAISEDDPYILDEVEETIQGLRTEYLAYNPKGRGIAYVALGTLGADTSKIESNVTEVSGVRVDGGNPLNFGLGGNFRMGRYAIFGITGSWGVSQDSNNSIGGVSLELYEMWQFTAGAGFRSTRNADREISYQFTAGVVWESVDADSTFVRDFPSSDDQAAFFLRFAAEFKKVSVFIQHGLGFKDTTDNLVGWSDQIQAGIGAVF